ncbi:MAG: chromosome segregation protein SMC [Paenirhodobacter sp.]|uniref:AAA family ATPase n=1 Tax=Paenirhodobacter sp. TaxID=1965326 RepID=UPI003D0BFA2F
MKLRALTLSNVRRFGGCKAVLSGIGDGLTVVSEANEFGKSTFFDALHALFFEKYSSLAKPVKSLQPHAGGGVAVQAEIEVEAGAAAGRFEISKRFLARKGAEVRDLASGAVIARDDEAEAWIARLFAEAPQGPAGLLWVRQGVVGLEPADGSKAERDRLAEARRDLLSSVAGEIDQITGGRRMDRILERCGADLEAIATATGRPRGAWKEQNDRVEALAAEHATLVAQCEELARALTERRAAEGELARLSAPAQLAAQQADLARAQAGLRAAQEHAARLHQAEQALHIAELTRDRAAGDLAALARALRDLAAAQAAQGAAEAELTAAQAARDGAAQKDQAQAAALRAAEARCADLAREEAEARRQIAAAQARREAGQLAARLATARDQHAKILAAQAALAANPVDARALARAEEAQNKLATLEAAQLARAARLRVRYDGAARITLDGAPLAPGAEVVLGARAELGLPGIGQVQIELPAPEDHAGRAAALNTARAALAAQLTACGAADLAGVRALAQARSAAQAARDLAQGLLAVSAPEGIAALEAAQARAAELGALAEAAHRAPAEIASEAAQAEAARAGARDAAERAARALTQAREAAIRAEAAAQTAAQGLGRAQAAAGTEADRDARLAQAQTEAAAWEAEVAVAQAGCAALRRDAPDLATAEADLARAESARAAAEKRRADLAQRLADLRARIETRAEADVEARRDETAEALASAQARAALFEAEHAALRRLKAALESAREAAREAYFGPVQQELAPLLAILHRDAGIDWQSDTLLPGALRRGGAVEEFETLSGGTQEQIAILTRLAFARLFARRGTHLPIILDDALVYSDDERIVKMFTALNRVARDQQIIVFSCRQLAFASLGGARPAISITEMG